MSEIRANNIVSENGLNPVGFSSGLTVTGVATATGFSGDGSELTGIPTIGDINTLNANIVQASPPTYHSLIPVDSF